MIKLIVSFVKILLLIVVSEVVKSNEFNKQEYNNEKKIINVTLLF